MFLGFLFSFAGTALPIFVKLSGLTDINLSLIEFLLLIDDLKSNFVFKNWRFNDLQGVALSVDLRFNKTKYLIPILRVCRPKIVDVTKPFSLYYDKKRDLQIDKKCDEKAL